MSRSTSESPWQLEGSLAAAYGDVFQGGSDRTHHADTTAIAPAGALVTIARGLARVALMLLDEGELDGVRILCPESVAEMMRLQARAHSELDEGFGLGFAVCERPPDLGLAIAHCARGLPRSPCSNARKPVRLGRLASATTPAAFAGGLISAPAHVVR